MGMKRSPISRGMSTLKRSPFKRQEARSLNPHGGEVVRKGMKHSKGKTATAAEKRYLGEVAKLGCALCRHLGLGPTPAIVHHQRTGTGMMRASHYMTCPLCPPHHQHSGYGLHDMGRPQFETMYGISEVELVQQTRTTLSAFLPEHERN